MKKRRGRDPRFIPPKKRRRVDVVSPNYQPNTAELKEDARADATFEEAVSALAQPVWMRYIERPKKRRR